MNAVIYLPTFTLEPIDVRNIEHAYAYLELCYDPDIQKNMFDVTHFLGEFNDILDSILQNEFFIRNQDGFLIGYLGMEFLFRKIVFEASIFSMFRGNHYLSKVLNELCEYLSIQFPMYTEFEAYVKRGNDASMKSLLNAHFSLQYDKDSCYRYTRKISKYED